MRLVDVTARDRNGGDVFEFGQLRRSSCLDQCLFGFDNFGAVGDSLLCCLRQGDGFKCRFGYFQNESGVRSKADQRVEGLRQFAHLTFSHDQLFACFEEGDVRVHHVSCLHRYCACQLLCALECFDFLLRNSLTPVGDQQLKVDTFKVLRSLSRQLSPLCPCNLLVSPGDIDRLTYL